MRIQEQQRFRQDFLALPETIKRRAVKQLALFLTDPRHPSLQVKKMKGHDRIWEGRITRDYRFTFQIEGEAYVLRRIGPHRVLDRP